MILLYLKGNENVFKIFLYITKFIIIILLQNEQLKDLNNLRQRVDDLQKEKSESTNTIKKLNCSVIKVVNEKHDVEITMEIQKKKFEKRESELLTLIQVSNNFQPPVDICY